MEKPHPGGVFAMDSYGAQYLKNSPGFPGLFFMCAQHGRCLAGERPVWRLVAATISQGQGRHCEVGSGGSRRQTCDLRNTKPIRGCEVGRVGMKQRSPMQPKTKAVNWTSAQGKSAFLPGETCCQAFFLGVTLVEKSD